MSFVIKWLKNATLCNILQHFATLFRATFFKKYAIKNCTLEESVCKIFFILFLVISEYVEAVSATVPLLFCVGGLLWLVRVRKENNLTGFAVSPLLLVMYSPYMTVKPFFLGL